jgi:hypothetical protein
VKEKRDNDAGYGTEFAALIITKNEPGSAVSTVAGYGLDDRAIEVRSPEEVKEFFV